MESKKKKIIIAAVIAVVVIGVAAAVYFALNKNDNNYVDVPVTEVVTNEMGEAVTDVKGQTVTEAVTDASGNPQTTKQPSGSNNQNANNNNNQGNNSGSGSDSDSDTTPVEKPEDKKPKSRKIKITAVLPQGCSIDDVMEIWVNGEKDSEITVGDYIESGNIVVVSTKESYKDEAAVEVSLKNYKTGAKGTLLNNYEEIRFDFPLNKVEDFKGEDD